MNNTTISATFMFTDIVGYSSLVNKDQTLALQLLEKHNPLPEDYLISADEELFPGSVRISNAERHTEDLIVDRLSEITEQIFESVEAHLLEPITHLENTKES